MASLTPAFGDFLPPWIAGQRWYRGTGRDPQLHLLAAIRWEDPLGEVGLEDHLLVDSSGPEDVVYQVPLSYRAEPVDFMADALVAVAEHDELGTRYIYDATHDPVFAQVLLQHMYAEHDVPSALARRVVAGGAAPALKASRVLSGEQSNTSIVVEAHGETRPVIVKVFRVLQAGANPDVTVPSAVAPLGNRMVAGPIGYVEGRWPLPDGTEARGHLAFAQEFLAGTQDAWRTALEAARSHDSFGGRARALGGATAQVHAALRQALPTDAVGGAAVRGTLLDQMRSRAEAAFAAVPELAAYRADVDAVYARLEDLDLPPLQRIHGDLHLGQVLDVPDRGWVLVDFEGEPLRPLAERSAPDLALRDVAGMLRSFDYAAASADLEEGTTQTSERTSWAQDARAEFLQGYAEASGEDLDARELHDVLDALELDKALYEVVYEARNRPDWMPIPVGAVQRLASGGRAGRHHAADEAGRTGAGGDGQDDGSVGRHRAPEDIPAGAGTAAGSEGPVAGDFGVAPDLPGHGASSLTDESGRLRTAALPEDYAATPAPQSTLPHLDPAAEGPSPRDAEDEEGATETSPEAAGPDETTATAEMTSTDESHQAATHGAPAPVPPTSPLPPASGGPRGASGGYPHAPVPAPAQMLAAAGLAPAGGAPGSEGEQVVVSHEPGPSVDRSAAAGTADRPSASGSVPALGPDGLPVDPEAMREQAWADALSSPAVVTGRVAGGGSAADEHGVPGTRSTVVRRVQLAPPTAPSAPHTRPLDLDEATDVVHGLHRSPHTVLGPHAHEGHVTIRTVQPSADAVSVRLADGSELAMTAETGGIWVAVVQQEQVPDYRLSVTRDGRQRVVDEAYRHEPVLGEADLHLIGEGRHEELWRVLGAHVRTVRDSIGEVSGTHFAVWAPNALAVHVIGDFNDWDGTTHALRVHETVGVWELFVPGVGAGAHYKFDITGPDGTRRAKSDPMARASEVPPFNNSVVTASTHRWSDGDAAWMARRAQTDPHHGPMSIYEVHLGSWRQGLGYEELADQLVDYVSRMGFTHVELMPVMQHPYGPSWGYHVTGYYAADSRFGHEDGLRLLIDRLHQAGVGVILDWVPGHFATDPWALARFDGTPIYEHPDPRKGWHPEWGSYIFDYGRPQVRNFLVANATYWLEEFHADGLRVDGVASMLYLDYSRQPGQWIPNANGGRENLEAVTLLQETNATAYRRNPGVMMIAEESTSWPGVTAPTDKGGLGFGFKWNMGWMHDTLDYLAQRPYSRAHHHHTLTFSLVYAFSEKYILPISHDEVVHGKGSLVRKMSGDPWQRFATTRAFLAYQWSHPGKQLLFMGSEFAQSREWADGSTLSWELTEQPAHAGVQHLVRDLNRLYDELPALWQIDHHEDGFAWLDANAAGRNLYTYLRWGNEGADGLRPVVAVLVNFSGIAQENVHVGLPYGGRWREALNTDAQVYGGSGQGNLGFVQAYDVEHQRQPFSALVTVPPLGAVWLVPDPEPVVEAPVVEAPVVEAPEVEDPAVDEAAVEEVTDPAEADSPEPVEASPDVDVEDGTQEAAAADAADAPEEAATEDMTAEETDGERRPTAYPEDDER